MDHNGSPRRFKLNLEDLQVESFEPLPEVKARGGTIRGYDTEQSECASACPTECDESCVEYCTTPGTWCDSFDTCPQVCATVVQMC